MIHNNEVGDNTPGYTPPTDGRTSVPEPKPEPDYLQVFMPHADVIDAFKRWVTSQGWELKPFPRFDEDDDTYVKTHMIVPANLDALMRQRAAEYREAAGNADG